VLGRMGEDAAPAVPALTALLDDPDLGVRKAAARTLGQIGPEAKDAVPALMRNLFQQPLLQSPPWNAPPPQEVPASSQPE
jgi:HEAT repeat protein